MVKQPSSHNYVYAYSSDIHNVATNALLTQQLSWYYFSSSNSGLWAKQLSRVWLPNSVQRPCLVNDRSFFEMPRHQTIVRPGSWHKEIIPSHEVLVSTFSRVVKAKRNSFHRLLEVAVAHTDHKQQCWIFCARSDFLREIMHSRRLHKFTSTWVVDHSALAMFASITGFIILHCFQCGEYNSAVATSGWSWWKNHVSTVSRNHKVTIPTLTGLHAVWVLFYPSIM